MKKSIAIAGLICAAAFAQAADMPHIQPGMYQMHVKMELPAEIAAKMPPGMNLGDQTVSHCITPEDAADPYRSMNAAKRKGAEQCETPKMQVTGNTVIADVQCKTGHSHMEGRFSADGYEADIQVSSAEMPGGHMNMHVSSKRIGECK